LRSGQQPWQHLAGVTYSEVAARRTFAELSAQSQFSVLDPQERAFLQAALQQDLRQRPTVHQLLQQEGGYFRAGPSCVLEPLERAAWEQQADAGEVAAAREEDSTMEIHETYLTARMDEYVQRNPWKMPAEYDDDMP
jgi:hypothetical protein